MQDLGIISPAMFKLFSECKAKFYYRYVEQIPMPMLDKSFITGKNIHALASYYLQGYEIKQFEKSLSEQEQNYWNNLKSNEYFNKEIIGIEKKISCKLDKYWIGGRLDAIVKDNDDIFILDYKTGGIKQDMTYDYQTMVYSVLLNEYYNNIPKTIFFVYLDLKNNKEHKIKLTEELKKEYKEKLLRTCEEMNTFRIEKFLPSKECSCEYSKICKPNMIS